MRFTFKFSSLVNNTEVITSFEATTIPEILENFDLFLRGVGFLPIGELEYVKDEFLNNELVNDDD